MVTEESPWPPALAARARSGFTGAAAGCFLLAVAVLTAIYATDTTSVRGVAAYSAICIGAGAATLWGARRYRPIDRAAWYLLALTPLLGCTGMVLRLLLAGVGGTTGSLIPDLVTIPGYLLLIAGLLRLLRVRRGSGAGSALDGGLMAVAALVMTWAILIEPALANAELPGALKVINGVYPTISVAVLFVGALLAMTEVRSILSFWMLALGWVGLLIGDLVYAFASVGTVILPLWAANCAYCTFFGLLGAAGLHPSMVSLSRPAAMRVRGYGHSRFVAVAVALLVPASVVAVGLPNGITDRAVSAILLSLLGVLVLVRITGAVNSHARSEMLLEHQANHDSLTGLPNRLHLGYHLDEALGRARIAARGVSVVFMDLDQFKVVNDSWGHETGDELLTVVAARLASTMRQGELVARMGGDEFVIVCEDVDTAAQAVDAGGRRLAVFNDPVTLRSAQVPVTSSIGVAFADPSVREVTVQDLLREADTAMYRSKMRGGAAVVLFDESMRKEVAERIALESSLVGALERGELQLFYQPIVDLHSGITTGFEALMRWEHPDLGMVPPTDFIPVAEDTGLILKLGRWAIEHAARQLREWHREFGDTLSMSVNLSPRQMFDQQLVPTVHRSLEDNQLPGGALCLEVTESALMENAETTMATITQLKQLGARLSADDFGTGYSSLAHLRMFPFDEVKVDRSFVAGLGDGGEDDVIVGAVMSMAQALSLATVAEGVETTAQRDRLLELGADHGQGWLFSAPLCARDATKHLFDVHGRAPIKL